MADIATATAPGKVILFGEHAVVYGQPAIALPVFQVQATATVEAAASKISLFLPDIRRRYLYASHVPEWMHPLLYAINLIEQQQYRLPPMTITVRSTIPVASGLGSGAATSAAMLRALLTYLDEPADDPTISDLTYKVEKLYHGTPSGIDNTVVSYQQPVYFRRKSGGNTIKRFEAAAGIPLIIADTGVRSETKAVVADVRKQWLAHSIKINALIGACGELTRKGRKALKKGNLAKVGRLMNDNHQLLQEMGVSSPELDTLVQAAQDAGALGAKLSGAGRGGNMIALVDEGSAEAVAAALTAAGATRLILPQLQVRA